MLDKPRPKQDVKLLGPIMVRPKMDVPTHSSSVPLAGISFAASAINQPGKAAETSQASGTPMPSPSSVKQAFPTRRVVRRIPQESPSSEFLEEWAATMKLEPVLGPLIPTHQDRIRVLELLYQYRHLNREDLRDLPCTDLITHRVRIAPGTKPASAKSQKRWPTHTEWWLRKLVQDGLEGGVYELTEPANGRLSLWNARAVMVDKVENPKPTDEPRMTFDYSRVTELLPGTHLELSSKVHDHLSNPNHGCLFSADLKHAYLTVPLHPDDRHYFAFTISGIGQIQPTRMQQGSQSAGFTMNELSYRAFGPIPAPSPEPSLLHSPDPAIPPPLVFYMDDFFGGFRDFEDLFIFLRDHFFPRVEWARLLLSFKKLRLFASSIKALGVVHVVGGLVQILEERIAKIMQWPVPSDQHDVRAFLGTIGITRRWVKNFAEIARPLSRLTGRVPWKWEASEQLSFELLQIKCATRTSMHGIDLNHVVHIYTDASGFAAGCAITQVRPNMSLEDEDPSGTISNRKTPEAKRASTTTGIEVPVLYDSFTFTSSQRNYPTYKRELCAIVTFCKKYDYLCKHPNKATTVFTDHKPLTYFLGSDLHEGIYGNWADQLRRLNITIKYIPGPRNKVADGLSRTIFKDPECANTPLVSTIQKALDIKGPRWVWKDGKDGYEALLDSLQVAERNEIIEHGSIHGISVFSSEAAGTVGSDLDSWVGSYKASTWFGDVYKLISNQYEGTPTASLLRKSLDYRIHESILWVHHARTQCYLPCIPEGKVLSVLVEVHDLAGHWAKTGTMARLRGLCYWPGQANDVERYIAGCLACAKHGPATRSQPLHPVMVTYPFQLMGMDFVGPLTTTSAGNRYILNLGCYMSRFSVPFACKNNNVEDVIWCLKLFFAMYRKPHAFYLDPGQHFGEELREFLRHEGIAISYRPSAAHKSTGMIEVMNRVLEDVVRKLGKQWDSNLASAGGAVNSRVISHLGISPKSIVLGPLPEASAIASTLLALPGRDLHAWAALLETSDSHQHEVHQYLQHRAETHDTINAISQRQKESMANRYDRGVKRAIHHLGDMVMLYQERSGKLQPRWRGPFKIIDYGGSHGASFVLQQLSGKHIRGSYHGDHLKKFVPRAGYLSSPSDPQLLQDQNIRVSQPRARLHLRPPRPPTACQ